MKSVSSPSGHKVSTRGQLSSLAVLKNIAQVKKSSVTVRLDIAKLFFQLGFCKPRSQEELAEKSGDGETDLENVQQQASSHFVSIVDGASDLEFVRSLHEYVKSLVDDTEETYQLRKPLTDEVSVIVHFRYHNLFTTLRQHFRSSRYNFLTFLDAKFMEARQQIGKEDGRRSSHFNHSCGRYTADF